MIQLKFPWNKYVELPLETRPTLQMFITNKCNLNCNGCFARKIMRNKPNEMSMSGYITQLVKFKRRGGVQINLLGGEPLLHPNISEICKINKKLGIKTTIYTNGTLLPQYSKGDFYDVKLRLSVYSASPYTDKIKSIYDIDSIDGLKYDVNFMVSAKTTLNELLDASYNAECELKSKVFFISSIRELDNPEKEFFNDTSLTMPVLEYKKLVHQFLHEYNGNMDIHISKRGVFESTTTLPNSTCNFANVFTDGRVIQCPYDIVNLKFQKDYKFGTRYCQQNNTCLMSKIILRKRCQSEKNRCKPN